MCALFSDLLNSIVKLVGLYRAQCRPEEICYYEANKERLAKQQKRKNFKEALWEIENTPNTLGPQALPGGTEIQRGSLWTFLLYLITYVRWKI